MKYIITFFFSSNTLDAVECFEMTLKRFFNLKNVVAPHWQIDKAIQRKLTLGGMCGVSKRNSCIIHPVLIPFGALFL